MSRQRTPEHEAIRKAKAKPERRWNMNRHCAWVWTSSWMFYTNWRGFSFSAGKIRTKQHGEQVPESGAQVSLDLWPFRFLVFWQGRRRVWIGQH